MPTPSRRDAAVRLLVEKGVWRSNYAPPALKALWKAGYDVPPPHFAPFWAVALVAGTGFALLWGAFMWLLIWSPQGLPEAIALVASCAAGALFGITMGGYFAYTRRKHNLPRWRDIAS
ncbi:MAG: DUF6404 family protein [Bdellovibrionota bacterium]